MIIFADIEPFSGFSMWVATVNPAFHTGLFTLYPYRGTLKPTIFFKLFHYVLFYCTFTTSPLFKFAKNSKAIF